MLQSAPPAEILLLFPPAAPGTGAGHYSTHTPALGGFSLPQTMGFIISLDIPGTFYCS